MAFSFVSNQSAIGTLTPNVYVNNITLESTGKTNLNDKNTSVVSIHTAYTEQLKEITDPMDIQGITSNLKIQSAAAAEDLYTNPASVAYPDSKLKVKIDMVLKEGMGGLAEFWSNKPDMHEYVKIGMAFSTNSLATKILAVGSNVLRATRSTAGDWNAIALSINSLVKLNILTDSEKKTLMDLGASALSFKAPFELQVKMDGSLGDNILATWKANIQEFLLNQMVGTSMKSLGEVMNSNMAVYEASNTPYFETDVNGDTLKNYKFSYEYIHDVNNPKHLSFCVLSYLDLEQMTNDFNIDFNIATTPHGKLIYEQIIDNFKVNTKSFLYVNPVDNLIWAGPVHNVTSGDGTEQDEGMQHWKTGFTETPDSFTVVRKVVANTKIQDFRVVERLEKLNFDLSFLETQVFNKGLSTKHLTNDKMDIVKQPAYFTPLYTSRDRSGNCRFMFGVDYYTLLLENTLFGKMWQPFDPSAFGNLKSNVRLINLKIKRRRVNNIPGASRLGGFNILIEPFKTGYIGESHISTEEIVNTIAEGKDETQGISFTSTSNLRENEIAFPDTGFTNLSHGVRFFSAIDREMPSITDGFYQYGVELEVIDNTVNYVLDRIGLLYSYYSMLCIYYEDAITPEAYDHKHNRFRPAFTAKWAGTNFNVEVITNLLDVINRFRPSGAVAGAGGASTVLSAGDALAAISSPANGTPRGINTLRKLVLDTCSKLAKMAGTSLKQFDDTPHTDDQNFDAVKTPKQAAYKTTTSNKRRIKIDYWFPNSFDSDIPKNVGYDYLSLGQEGAPFSEANQASGLWTLGGVQYKNRVAAEILKYFDTTIFNNDDFVMELQNGDDQITPGDTPDTTGYTFFTPSHINLGPSTAADTRQIPFIPLGGDAFGLAIAAAGSLAMPPTPNLDTAADLNIDKSSWSMLDGGVFLNDTKTLSYIATKIMNYNLGGRLPPTNTTTNQETGRVNKKTSAKIKFNLNEILAHQNCTAVVQKLEPPVTTIITDGYLDPAYDTVDSYESNLTPADEQFNVLEAEVGTTSQNYLFLALAYYFSRGCSGGAGDLTQKDFNINFFNLNGEVGTIIPALMPQIDPVQGMKSLIPIFMTLPNAIKSLLLFNRGHNRYDWNDATQNLTSNANYKGSFALNYQNIKKVEVFVGFEKNDVGQLLINKGKWVPLDKNMFEQNFNQKLLCRLATYKNEAFGVKLPSCLELPVFHEYFVLNPSNAPATIVVPQAVQNPPPIVPINLLSSGWQGITGATTSMNDFMSTGVGITDVVAKSKFGAISAPGAGAGGVAAAAITTGATTGTAATAAPVGPGVT